MNAISPAQRLVLVQFALFALMGLAVIFTPASSPPATRVMGVVLIAAGIVLVALAIVTYQVHAQRPPKVSPEPPDPARGGRLITQGVYSHIRHPIYGGVLLTAFGIALMHGHILVWALVAALYIFFYSKSRYEEALLLHVYPEYAKYLRRTGRFLPGLGR